MTQNVLCDIIYISIFGRGFVLSMKTRLRMISIILALVTSLSSLASCNTEGEQDSAVTSAVTEETVTEKIEVTTTVEDLLGIPENDYNCDFNLWIMQDTNVPKYHWVEESENDVLSQAIFARQQNVYDYLGVNVIGTSVSNYQEYSIPFKTAVKNKDGSVDTMLCHVFHGVPPLVSENYLFDVSDLPGVNIGADYWNQQFMDDLVINDHYFLGFSDFNILYTHVISFNKTMMEQYANSLEKSVYDMVRDKEWTVDQMISLANLVYIDQTANGKSEDDTFGITGLQYNEFTGFLHASGIKIMEQDESGQYKVVLMSEKYKDKTSALVDKIRGLVESDCSYFDYGKTTGPTVPFTSGRTLMHLSRTEHLANYLGHEELSFGVLPYPLWDCEQDSYHHLQWGGYITVPSYLRDVQMASETLEMLSYYSSDVKVAYYEKMLGKQVADAVDDSQMLSIVWDTVCTEFAQTYSQALGGSGLVYMMASVTEAYTSVKLASSVASLERSANSSISKFWKKLDAYKGS